MKIAISIPTGFHARELLLPLAEHLEKDASIDEVSVITPAAPYHTELFPTLSKKFSWHKNPADLAGHISLLSSIKPSVILTPTVGLDLADTNIIRAGKKIGIPTVTFVASWDNVFKMERLRDKGFSGVHKNVAADYEFPQFMAVWNQMNYDHILKKFAEEIDSTHLTITGPPRFDHFAHVERIPSKEELIRYLGWGVEKASLPLLHFATTELYPFEYIIREVHRAQKKSKIPSALLYASVHPGGDISKHQHYTKYGAQVKYSFGRRENSPLPQFAYLPTAEEIYMLIALWKHTAVLINQSSTVAIESMAADIPVINVTYGQPFDWVGWRRSMVYRDFQQHYQYITDYGGTTLVQHPRQLVTEINRSLENPQHKQAERRQTLLHLITHADGKNSERFISYLKACAA